MKRNELLTIAKNYRIKGIYKMKKTDLEYAIYLYECASWFNDIIANTITITNDDANDISLDIIDLNEQAMYNYKKWDIEDEEKIDFLLNV
jgi:hypothetical protein|tara:strand:+ start:45 stop:314 length:270 start_codon:yes stop_codon:yes gene_type:complete